MSFADLGLSDQLLRAIGDSGYDVPTPIQKGAIPSVLMGKDLIGIACSHAAMPLLSPPRPGSSSAMRPYILKNT
jgi:hypothetical protein